MHAISCPDHLKTLKNIYRLAISVIDFFFKDFFSKFYERRVMIETLIKHVKLILLKFHISQTWKVE